MVLIVNPSTTQSFLAFPFPRIVLLPMPSYSRENEASTPPYRICLGENIQLAIASIIGVPLDLGADRRGVDMTDTRFERAKFDDFLIEVRPYIEILGDLYRKSRRP